MTPEEPTPKPGIRYGGLMCPHGMVRGACAICRNPPPSPKLEAESVEPWKPEAERMAYEALNAAYLACRAELAAERSAREKAEAERDELALLTVPSDADAQVAVRLRIAEARVAELEAERAEQDASDTFDSLLREGYDPPEARAILARSAKGGANG